MTDKNRFSISIIILLALNLLVITTGIFLLFDFKIGRNSKDITLPYNFYTGSGYALKSNEGFKVILMLKDEKIDNKMKLLIHDLRKEGTPVVASVYKDINEKEDKYIKAFKTIGQEPIYYSDKTIKDIGNYYALIYNNTVLAESTLDGEGLTDLITTLAITGLIDNEQLFFKDGYVDTINTDNSLLGKKLRLLASKYLPDSYFSYPKEIERKTKKNKENVDKIVVSVSAEELNNNIKTMSESSRVTIDKILKDANYSAREVEYLSRIKLLEEKLKTKDKELNELVKGTTDNKEDLNIISKHLDALEKENARLQHENQNLKAYLDSINKPYTESYDQEQPYNTQPQEQEDTQTN